MGMAERKTGLTAALALAALGLLLPVERRAHSPLVPLVLLRRPAFCAFA